MPMKKTLLTITILVLLLLLPGCGPSLDDFAKCVTESGMTLYGTYWCPHCQNVKKSFGSSIQFINVIECDANGPDGNPEKCEKDGVQAYPTFIFGDGLRVEGELTLELIADKTGCTLPE
ncbi:hypothetical protein ACFL0V_01600 [Nanoarchaeota archaeon]